MLTNLNSDTLRKLKSASSEPNPSSNGSNETTETLVRSMWPISNPHSPPLRSTVARALILMEQIQWPRVETQMALVLQPRHQRLRLSWPGLHSIPLP